MRRKIAGPLAALLVTFFGARLEARTWTDVLGRKIEAELIAHDDTEVVLRLANGRNATVPLSRLCEADIAFLNGETEETPEPAPVLDSDDKDEPAGEPLLNWDEPWPESVDYKADPEINVVEEDETAKRWVYESSHYRFICDVRLSKSVVSNFAEMFESTLQYTRALPLAITGGTMREGRFEILLFEEFDDYVKAGGPPTSAGVFIGGKNQVMVPLESLGVRKVGSGYMRDRDKSNKTLVHELTHQLTPGGYYIYGAMGWFTEGLAEYCAVTPYRNGRFKVRNTFDSLKDYTTGYDRKTQRGRAIGTSFSAPDLREFMLMDYGDFTGTNANFNYAFGAIVTGYFVHLDGEGDAARLKNFLKKIRQGEEVKDGDGPLSALLDGRTWDQLEKEIAKAWSRKGVDIEFD
ncbi:SHD1 domain-containing protein [Haloferula sargassicola]